MSVYKAWSLPPLWHDRVYADKNKVWRSDFNITMSEVKSRKFIDISCFKRGNISESKFQILTLVTICYTRLCRIKLSNFIKSHQVWEILYAFFSPSLKYSFVLFHSTSLRHSLCFSLIWSGRYFVLFTQLVWGILYAFHSSGLRDSLWFSLLCPVKFYVLITHLAWQILCAFHIPVPKDSMCFSLTCPERFLVLFIHLDCKFIVFFTLLVEEISPDSHLPVWKDSMCFSLTGPERFYVLVTHLASKILCAFHSMAWEILCAFHSPSLRDSMCFIHSSGPRDSICFIHSPILRDSMCFSSMSPLLPTVKPQWVGWSILLNKDL